MLNMFSKRQETPAPVLQKAAAKGVGDARSA